LSGGFHPKQVADTVTIVSGTFTGYYRVQGSKTARAGTGKPHQYSCRAESGSNRIKFFVLLLDSAYKAPSGSRTHRYNRGLRYSMHSNEIANYPCSQSLNYHEVIV
jgi:hypothetical protein